MTRASPANRSTHAFGVAEALELARALNRLPPCLLIYGIEGKNFAMGTGLSPEVRTAAFEITKLVIRNVYEYNGDRHFHGIATERDLFSNDGDSSLTKKPWML